MRPSARVATIVLLMAGLFRPYEGGGAARKPAPPGPLFCAGCAGGVLKRGRLGASGGLRLGAPVEFDDGLGINGGRCFPLHAGRAFVTWLDSYHRTGRQIYLRRCVEDASVRDVAPGSRGGSVEDGFEELSFTGRRPKFARVSAPHWSGFSNPSFCESRMAYWGVESPAGGPPEVYAVLFDLNGRRVLKRERLGAISIESDSRDFFPAPQWGAAGRDVTFEAARAGLKKVTLPVKSL